MTATLFLAILTVGLAAYVSDADSAWKILVASAFLLTTFRLLFWSRKKKFTGQ
jgi:hypothetical protein